MNLKVTGQGEEDAVPKKIVIFTYKQLLLIIFTKTKVVQHVPRSSISI